jgi:HAD superfamily hydrolase (TIGR01509 family)
MQLTNLQAVALDMDGVLIDSEPLHEESLEILFGQLGISVPMSVVSGFKGKTETEVFLEVINGFSLAGVTPIELIRRKHVIFGDLLHKLDLVPGVLDFIEFVREAGCMLALTTSAERASQQRAFGKFSLDSFFRVVVTAEDVTLSKPDPQPYSITVDRLSVEPGKCLVVEDSVNGVMSGVRAGCAVAGLTTTFPGDALREAGAHLIVDSFHELTTALR